MLGDPEVTYAAAPFDHAKADIILRSSDNHDFRVFKLFLSLASPFFETLFNIPQPAEANGDEEIKDGLTVIRVQESSKTLDTLLRFCYPCTLAEDPNLEVLEDLADVLEATQKYALDVIERKIRQALSNPKILEAEPLRCFAIAHRGRAREETLLAAKHTLTLSLIPSWFQEINLLTAADLLALLTYHQQCGDAVYALKDNMSWIESHYGSSQGCAWFSSMPRPLPGSRSAFGAPSSTSAFGAPASPSVFGAPPSTSAFGAPPSTSAFGVPPSTSAFGTPASASAFGAPPSTSTFGAPTSTGIFGNPNSSASCSCATSTTAKYQLFGFEPLRWWEVFMEETFMALRDKPCKATVEGFVAKAVQSVRAQGCSTCSVNISEHMGGFSELLTKKVEGVVSEIQLVLPF